ncbi:hypothetical protein [Desulfosporosinus sp. SB140]|uniref:hypothetical protein n=1 Tax=Desulfosporosinus paludis TaxID=3115649 RepID=UPI00388E0F27
MIESFNHIENETNWLEKPPRDLEEETVTLSQIFTSQFMQLHTQFGSIEELLSSGGFEINSEEDYDAIPDRDIDAHVAVTTNFSTWKEMLIAAADAYLVENADH